MEILWEYPEDFLRVWDGYGDRNSVPTAALWPGVIRPISSSSSSLQTFFKVALTVKTIARTTVLGWEIMTRKKKCNSESNSFVAAVEQVCLQPVLEHRHHDVPRGFFISCTPCWGSNPPVPHLQVCLVWICSFEQNYHGIFKLLTHRSLTIDFDSLSLRACWRQSVPVYHYSRHII